MHRARWSASQPVPRILWNLRVHYREHNSPPVIHTLKQINPVQVLSSCYLNTYTSNVVPSMPRSYKWNVSPPEPYAHFSVTCPAHVFILEYKLWNSAQYTLLLLPAYQTMGPNVFRSTPFSSGHNSLPFTGEKKSLITKSFCMRVSISTFRSDRFWRNLVRKLGHWTMYFLISFSRCPCTTPKRTLGVQEFEAHRISRQSAHRGGKVVSPTHRPPLTPGDIPGTHCCYRLSPPQSHIAAGRIKSMIKSNPIGNRTRDLPACSAVHRPTATSRAPFLISYS